MVVTPKSATNRRARGIAGRTISLLMALLVVFVPWVVAAESVDLTAMSLEELMEIEITSVARKPQKLSDTAAAAFIITQEDIQRSGVTTVMDALRMAPGLQVAQIDGNKWAITSRGFNNRFANKLLVLMDGRTIYSHFSSGVLWEAQDLILEDIERIEVIRGPGGSIWGANAVNGIINIITKSAAETQGTLVSGGGGTHERVFGAVRHGGTIGANTDYRVFAKAADREGFDELSGEEGNNDWQTAMAGFRADGILANGDTWGFHGSLRSESMGQSYGNPILESPYYEEIRSESDDTGGYLQGNWTHRLASGSETALQMYYAHDKYDDINTQIMEDTLDVDFQHRFDLGRRHEITWGAGYRFIYSDTEPGLRVHFEPERMEDHLFSTFIQDQIDLLADTVALTLGSKFEHNSYTGFEVQPSARIRWNIDATHTLWGAVSRAVRTPSRGEVSTVYQAAVFPPMPPMMVYPTSIYTVGSEKFDSETAWTYEIGYRNVLNEWVSLDLTTFFSRYDNIQSYYPTDTTFESDPSAHYVMNVGWGNETEGESYGFEAAVDLIPQQWWKLRLSYTWFDLSLDGGSGPFAKEMEAGAEYSPEHQVSVLSMMELPYGVQLDAWLRYVSELEPQDVPAYLTLDLRLAWHPVKDLELSLVGRNLLDPGHPEYKEAYLDTSPVEVERSFYGKLTWKF